MPGKASRKRYARTGGSDRNAQVSSRKASRYWRKHSPATQHPVRPNLTKSMALDTARRLGKSGEGDSASTSASSVLRSWNDTNPSGAMAEVRYRITDFMDSFTATSTAGQQYQVNLKNIPGLPIAGDASKPVAKIKGAKLFALPNFAMDPSDTAFVILFGIPILTSIQAPSTDAQLDCKYAAQKTTVVTPTANMDWVLVGEWNDSIFQNSNIIPAESDKHGTVIAEWSVVDTDKFNPLAKGVQFMIEYEIEQAVPQITYFPSLFVQTFKSAGAWNGPVNGVDMEENAVWVEPLAVTKAV